MMNNISLNNIDLKKNLEIALFINYSEKYFLISFLKPRQKSTTEDKHYYFL